MWEATQPIQMKEVEVKGAKPLTDLPKDIQKDIERQQEGRGVELPPTDVRPITLGPDDLSTDKLVKVNVGIESVDRNNPLNLRRTSIKWDGKVPSDGAFEEFKNPVLGLRAGIKNITNKLKTGKTLKEVINIISPPSENPTDKMVKEAARLANIKPTDKVDITNTKIVKGIIDGLLKWEAENFKYSDKVINKAIKLAIK